MSFHIEIGLTLFPSFMFVFHFKVAQAEREGDKEKEREREQNDSRHILSGRESGGSAVWF